MMRSPNRPYKVIVPRCKTCNGRFPLHTKVSCIECDCDIHYDCAVYEDDESNFMMCIDCFKNMKIEEALECDGVRVKVKGDDLCRAYIGSSFWEDYTQERFDLTDCDEELSYDECDDACPYCGWRCEYEQSHIQYGNTGCKYINELYDIEIDEDGEVIGKEKSFEITELDLKDLEPFESSDFTIKK